MSPFSTAKDREKGSSEDCKFDLGRQILAVAGVPMIEKAA